MIPHIPNYHPLRIRHRLYQLILLLYITAIVGCAAMVIGPLKNDREIEASPQRTLARVTNVSPNRTTVEYQDNQGMYHSPETGLLYPTGLGEGQRVWVDYAETNPDLVKVAGRSWTLSVVPALSSALVVTVIAALLWWGISVITSWYLRRRSTE
ncbi:hypothetical protein UL82_01360 [Corynebacterium kutscheri]|uniref:DUF3592 domain-containing protein n=1 Tax=Corynebacterium kutscheri TaxID=35755 RepID=A0A0F6TC37_9CORY|nr:hypothetical protein UL82_01360 [Corynebacterium kutscheri]VEH10899.1 hypothetical membrane protein [Corynebacterium kutscheri]